MSAPDLIPQTPGDPLANTTPAAPDTAGAGDPPAPTTPVFTAKHNGGGRWIVIDPNAPKIDGKDVKVGDFTGTKEEALAEADRLCAGGDPLVLDPERLADKEALAKPAPAARAFDAATLKQAVMTPDGWLCPEPPAAKE